MQPSDQTLLPRWCVLIGLLFVHAAAAESPPPLEWLRNEALHVTWPQEGQAQPAKVQVLNRSSSPQNVQVRLIPVDSSTMEMAGSFIDVTPPKAMLGPGKAITFTISAQSGAERKPSTYESVLVAYSDVPGSWIRLDIKITVQPKETPASERTPKFLVEKVQLRDYRCLRWCPCDPPQDAQPKPQPCLRLCWGPCEDGPLEDAEILASVGPTGSWKPPKSYLATEDGETVELSLHEPEDLADGGILGLKVKVDDIDRVGTYTGKLTVGAGKESGEAVDLNLTVAHHPLFAVLAVFLGIVLALCIQHYMGVLRLTWSLAQREAEVGMKFNHAQQAFYEKAADQPFAFYALSDLEARRKVLRKKIVALQRSVFTSLDTTNPKYLEIDTELKVLEAVPEQWEGFALKLFSLADALDDIAWGKASAYLEPAPERPAIAERMQLLKAGSAITVQQLGERFTEVSKGPDLVAAWLGLNRRAAALHARLVSLKAEAAKAELTILEAATAETALVPIWNRLWSYADIDPAAQTGLDTVENHLAIVRTLIPETSGANEAIDGKLAALGASANVAAVFQRLTVAPVQQPVSDVERLRLLHQRQRLSAWAVALVGFLIALYTGMKLFYLAKPFGYWLDYVEIVAWAVVAQSVLDLLLKGLDRIWGLGGLFRGRTT